MNTICDACGHADDSRAAKEKRCNAARIKAGKALLVFATLAFGLGFIILRASFQGCDRNERARGILIEAGTPQAIADSVVSTHSIPPGDRSSLPPGAAAAVAREISEYGKKIVVGWSLMGTSLLMGLFGVVFTSRPVGEV